MLDVIAMDQPYIVSDASDWNAEGGRFDSKCGGKVCVGGTGYVDNTTDTKTFSLRLQHYVLPNTDDVIPKFSMNPPAMYFVDSVPRPSYVAGAWEWGSGGYISFGPTQFLATPVGVLKAGNSGFTAIITFRYMGRTASTTLLRYSGIHTVDSIRIATAADATYWDNQYQGCSASFRWTPGNNVWSTIIMRYEKSTNRLSTMVNTRTWSSVVCPANSVRDAEYRGARLGFGVDIAGAFVINAFLTDAEVNQFRASINAGKDSFDFGHPGKATTGTVTGNGAATPVAFVGGGVNVKMQWGALSVPLRFTICSVTRYSGENRNMILGCAGNTLGDLNFIHGHANGIAGATRYGDNGDATNWSPVSISPNTNWVVVCGRNTVAANSTSVIVNGVVRASAVVQGGSSCALGINQNAKFNSDWQLSNLYVWNYHLSDQHFDIVSLSLNAALLGPVAPTGCLSCPNNSFSAANSFACKCNAGYVGADGGTCLACVAGKYKVSTGSAGCTDCLAGQYSTAVGATSNVCRDCPSHSTSRIGSTEASNCSCNAGFSRMNTGMCVECTRGKYMMAT